MVTASPRWGYSTQPELESSFKRRLLDEVMERRDAGGEIYSPNAGNHTNRLHDLQEEVLALREENSALRKSKENVLLDVITEKQARIELTEEYMLLRDKDEEIREENDNLKRKIADLEHAINNSVPNLEFNKLRSLKREILSQASAMKQRSMRISDT